MTALLLTLLVFPPEQLVTGYWRPHLPAPAAAEVLGLVVPTEPSLAVLENEYAENRRPAALYALAEYHRAHGNHDEAEVLYRAFLARAPYSDPNRDAAWDRAVEYEALRRAQGEQARRELVQQRMPYEGLLLLWLAGVL